LETF
jgi:RecA/RadA recombinase